MRTIIRRIPRQRNVLMSLPTVTRLVILQQMFENAKSLHISRPCSWNTINHILAANRTIYDFNAIPVVITNASTFNKAVKAAQEAKTKLTAPWLYITCNSCKKDISLSRVEVDVYRKNNLPLPQMCHECRSHYLIKEKRDVA